MLRNKAASYAISAMIELARQQRADGEPREVRANVIAERHQLPVSYTAKILSQLAKASLLHSGRGPSGGFLLARSAEEITLLDVLKAVGAVSDGSMELSDQVPASVRTNVDGAMKRAVAETQRVLSETTLSDLLADLPEEDHASGNPQADQRNDVHQSRMADAIPA